jgi:hypothetical protein
MLGGGGGPGPSLMRRPTFSSSGALPLHGGPAGRGGGRRRGRHAGRAAAWICALLLVLAALVGGVAYAFVRLGRRRAHAAEHALFEAERHEATDPGLHDEARRGAAAALRAEAIRDLPAVRARQKKQADGWAAARARAEQRGGRVGRGASPPPAPLAPPPPAPLAPPPPPPLAAATQAAGAAATAAAAGIPLPVLGADPDASLYELPLLLRRGDGSDLALHDLAGGFSCFVELPVEAESSQPTNRSPTTTRNENRRQGHALRQRREPVRLHGKQLQGHAGNLRALPFLWV